MTKKTLIMWDDKKVVITRFENMTDNEIGQARLDFQKYQGQPDWQLLDGHLKVERYSVKREEELE